MARWGGLLLMALMLMPAAGCAAGGSLEGRAGEGRGQPPAPGTAAAGRFNKAANGVIADSATGLEWYVNPSPGVTWGQARAWAETLTVAGGGWRLPTMAELQALYLQGASRINMDPLFQADGAWVWSGELRNAWSAWGYAFYNGLKGWHHVDYPNGRVALAVRPRR